ncbi:MAG: hypothetical protein QMD85_04380 [Candidatus Aenigmarchaeota archaeon]|nr:hypothetical protein [Candidatus Aenigmarchaeota archaeon]MDI6722809.1 hypothetical protein [Candidatus Aenigmarchaeota archaeon]
MEYEKNVAKKCRYCSDELKIPEEIYGMIESAKHANNGFPFSMRGQKNGFYVSACGNIYCNEYCGRMFTED